MNPQPVISDTARAVLVTAAERADDRAPPPERLPIAAQRSVVHSLLRAGLVEEAAADAAEPGWRTDDGGARIGLRLTAAGLRAVGEPTASPAIDDAAPQPEGGRTDVPGHQLSDDRDAFSPRSPTH